MNKTKLIIILYPLLLFLPFINKAQMADWKNFNSQNSGLPSDVVVQIRQDSLNNMWFATLDGLVRFDGKTWEVFNDKNTKLPFNIIDDFQFDNNGHIWLLSSSYLVDFNYTQKSMNLIDIDSIDYCEVLNIDKDNNKWLGHYTRLIKYDNQKFQTYLNWEDISSIGIVGDSIFVGTSAYRHPLGGKLFLAQGKDSVGEYFFNDITNQLPVDKESLHIREIVKDKFGGIWVATSNGVAFSKNNEWHIYDINDWGAYVNGPDYDNNYSTGVAFDKNGNLWVALLFEGLLIYDGSDWKSFTDETFENNFNLTDLKIWKIFSDNKGDIWIGTNDGIFVYSGEFTKVEEINKTNYKLDVSCYPNPFNNATKVFYSVENIGLIKIDVYNILGERVRNLVNEFKATGEYSIEFSGRNLPSGVYFYKIESRSFTKIKKMLLLR